MNKLIDITYIIFVLICSNNYILYTSYQFEKYIINRKFTF